jgi:hypothetical protein
VIDTCRESFAGHDYCELLRVARDTQSQFFYQPLDCVQPCNLRGFVFTFGIYLPQHLKYASAPSVTIAEPVKPAIEYDARDAESVEHELDPTDIVFVSFLKGWDTKYAQNFGRWIGAASLLSF